MKAENLKIRLVREVPPYGCFLEAGVQSQYVLNSPILYDLFVHFLITVYAWAYHLLEFDIIDPSFCFFSYQQLVCWFLSPETAK